MEFLQPYYHENKGLIQIDAEQGASFAQGVAGDFNPIHYPDSKRFCVPGDLLFAIALEKYGLSQEMKFEFLDMVKGGSLLSYPERTNNNKVEVAYGLEEGALGKKVLSIDMGGGNVNEADKIENVIRQYVSFSGRNFPHILLPLMREHEVMINPARPLVIYQSMSFGLQTLDFEHLEITLGETSLNIDGKRGEAIFNFDFSEKNKPLGSGQKSLILSGLRPYDHAKMQSLTDEYMARANAA